MQLVYEKPTAGMKNEILAFMQCFYDHGETVVHGSAGLDVHGDYEKWLAYLQSIENGAADVFLPSVVYVARAAGSGDIVGILDVRPALPPTKLDFGHIGYAVAPPYRRKGIATDMLRKGVQMLQKAGVTPIYIDCYEDNAASHRVIEKAGFTERRRYADADNGRTVIEFTLPG